MVSFYRRPLDVRATQLAERPWPARLAPLTPQFPFDYAANQTTVF